MNCQYYFAITHYLRSLLCGQKPNQCMIITAVNEIISPTNSEAFHVTYVTEEKYTKYALCNKNDDVFHSLTKPRAPSHTATRNKAFRCLEHVARQSMPCAGASNGKRPVIDFLSRSSYDQVAILTTEYCGLNIVD